MTLVPTPDHHADAAVAILTLAPVNTYTNAELWEACRVYRLLNRGRLVLAPSRTTTGE